MSEPVLLPAIFKGATEVTTLASTDRLMVISSDGTPKKIGKDILTDTLTFNAKANTWYQIMVGSLGGTASVGSLLIVSDPVSQEALSLDWCISRSSSVERQDLHIFNPPIDRYPRIILSNLPIRIPPTAGKSFYLDLYVTDQKRISVKLGQSFNAALSLIENPQVDSTYAIMEYDLSVFGGGVKRYLPTFYKIAEKGGSEHERTDIAEQHPLERIDARCNGLPRYSSINEYPQRWLLAGDSRRHKGYPRRIIPIWHPRSPRRHIFHVATLHPSRASKLYRQRTGWILHTGILERIMDALASLPVRRITIGKEVVAA